MDSTLCTLQVRMNCLLTPCCPGLFRIEYSLEIRKGFLWFCKSIYVNSTGFIVVVDVVWGAAKGLDM